MTRKGKQRKRKEPIFRDVKHDSFYCYRLLPRDCQIVLFSATWAERVRKFAEEIAPHANQITLKPEELSVDGIKQFYVDCRDAAKENKNRKYDILVGLYSLLTVSQSIIFVKVRKETPPNTHTKSGT